MIIVGILLFALLVVFHELGHFWAARRAGVTVEEFGIGFPPRLMARKFGKSKTLYSLNLIPLGGFVKLKGESAQDNRPRSFGRTSFKNKAKILLAGVAMNFLAAYLILTGLAVTGVPQLVEHQFSIKSLERARTEAVVVAAALEGTPAMALGLTVGDKLIAIDGQPLTTSQQLSNYTHAHPDQTVSLVYQHDGREVTTMVKLNHTDEGKGQLGVVPFDDKRISYSWGAPLEALGLSLQLVWQTLVGIWGIISGLISQGASAPAVSNAVGPVGAFALLQTASHLGYTYLLILIVAISASLAVVNALPLPALDGGRLFLISVFKLSKKPLQPKLENAVHAAGFLVLVGLILLLSYFDVHRFY